MLWVLFGHWVEDRSQSPPCCEYYLDIVLEIALSHRHVVGIIRTLGVEIAISHHHVVGIIRTLG